VYLFFGLESSDRAAVVLEPVFLLMYYMGFTYVESYNIPVEYKRWFIKRVEKELSQGKEDGTNQSKALQHNTPDARALTGKARAQVPSKLRRFT